MPGPPPPDDAARIEELVEAVQGHARSLVLLAPEIHRQGVTVTAAALAQLMAQLHAAYPDDRQRSLFASVELSLQRLTPEMRRAIRPLGVFQGEADLDVLAWLLGVEKKELAPMVRALLDTNLAELMPYDHLRLHPALCPYLAAGLTAEETEALTARWADGMRQLVDYLHRQLFQDTQLAFTLTRLELPNLLRLLEHLSAAADAAATLDVANKVEQLLADLDCPRLLRRVVALRERASAQLGGGLSDAQFHARGMEIERLLQAGQLQPAYEAAQRLLAESGAPEAGVSAGNQALAFDLLGTVLFAGGAAGEALARFQKAQARFAALGQAGARMAAVALTEQGDCLLTLGRLDEAARAYEQAIERFENLEDKRSAASAQGNLATVRLYQGRYAEALAAYEAARSTFADLGEPRMVATAWHQIGNVHYEAGDAEAAEAAYRQALALKVKLQDRAGEANTLTQLGNLYDSMGRLEEAATFCRQAADRYVPLGDQANEGRARNNLAGTLVKLGRCDEARAELQRAIACNKPYGHAAEPWKTWAVLHDLERAEGNAATAEQAKAEARRLYLAYRRDGGENHSRGGRLCAAFLRAVQAGATAEMAARLRQLAAANKDDAAAMALLSALQAILNGARDPALADDPALTYDFAAEVELLLAALAPL